MRHVAALLLATACAGCGSPPAAPAPPSGADLASTPASAPAPVSEKPPAGAGPTDWRAYYTGDWTRTGDDGQPDNPCGSDLPVRFDRPVSVCVEDNQVVVTARWVLDDAAGVARLFLVGPEDVGAGGARLPWDAFDRAAPLATFAPAPGEGRFATLAWHGLRAPGASVADLGQGNAGDYEPADGDTRIPTR